MFLVSNYRFPLVLQGELNFLHMSVTDYYIIMQPLKSLEIINVVFFKGFVWCFVANSESAGVITYIRSR